MHSTPKVPLPQLYQLSEKGSIKYASLSAIFNPLYSSTNQKLFESTSVIKVATIKDMDNFHNATTKLRLAKMNGT